MLLFLRKIESLESIVVTSNIRIENNQSSDADQNVKSSLKLELSAYGRTNQ